MTGDRPTECGEKKNGRGEQLDGGTSVVWEPFPVSQLLMDLCLVYLASFSATSAITLSFLQLSTMSVTTLAQEFLKLPRVPCVCACMFASVCY